jgi:hypothetical protein
MRILNVKIGLQFICSEHPGKITDSHGLRLSRDTLSPQKLVEKVCKLIVEVRVQGTIILM